MEREFYDGAGEQWGSRKGEQPPVCKCRGAIVFGLCMGALFFYLAGWVIW